MAVQFTESEWLILSSLGYVIPKDKFDKNGYPVRNKEIKVVNFLDELEQKATDGGINDEKFKNTEDKENYLRALKSLKAKLKDGDYIISKSIDHNASNQSGFAAISIEPKNNINNEVIVCCRGSDGMKLNPLDKDNTINDWLFADAALVLSEQTMQQEEMKNFLKGFEKYNDISLVGHSLGGNLAMYGAITFEYPGKISGVYSFDGPGFNQAFFVENSEKIKRINDKIYNYQNEHDLVSSSLRSIGNLIVLEASIESDNVIKNHNRWSIAVDPDGRLRRNKTGQKDIICNSYNHLSNQISDTFDIGDIVLTVIINVGSSLYKNIGNSINDFINKNFNEGYKYASNNTYIQLNTATLRTYADKLSHINKRICKLDRNMDSLYTKVGFQDLWNLLQADLLTGYSWRLDRCIKYLNDTASDFEMVERTINSQI